MRGFYKLVHMCYFVSIYIRRHQFTIIRRQIRQITYIQYIMRKFMIHYPISQRFAILFTYNDICLKLLKDNV